MPPKRFKWAQPDLAGLQKISDRWWFFPFQGLLAGLDHWIAIVPTDGLLIGSLIIHPKKWWLAAICFAVGSTAGAATVVWAVREWGPALVDHLQPTLRASEPWLKAEMLLRDYGNWAVFLIGMSPFPMFPPLALFTLAGLEMEAITTLFFAGRMVKYIAIGLVASHAPKVMDRFLGRSAAADDTKSTPDHRP
ncbi:MAG: hypothetical protein JNL01_02000 [Bdellovibrionales bacterium]|nr:hypothetical protein [Bdellovibrionales bacterium]